jgi:hypothetical protein
MNSLDKMTINRKGQPLAKNFRGGGIAKRGFGAALRGGGIAKGGKGIALKTGGRAALWHGGPHNRGRTNLLEQLGRVEGERSNPNRRAEISRVHGELNRGYKDGGRTGYAFGTAAKVIGKRLAEKLKKKKKVYPETEDLTHQVGPYVGDVGSEGKKKKKRKLPIIGKMYRGKPGKKTELIWAKPLKGDYYKEPTKWGGYDKRTPGVGLKSGGRIGLKEGTDKKWIQKATKGMVKTKPCTGKKFGSKTCPPGSRRYNLAKTFKKMGRERKAEG